MHKFIPLAIQQWYVLMRGGAGEQLKSLTRWFKWKSPNNGRITAPNAEQPRHISLMMVNCARRQYNVCTYDIRMYTRTHTHSFIRCWVELWLALCFGWGSMHCMADRFSHEACGTNKHILQQQPQPQLLVHYTEGTRKGSLQATLHPCHRHHHHPVETDTWTDRHQHWEWHK